MYGFPGKPVGKRANELVISDDRRKRDRERIFGKPRPKKKGISRK
jgi:hypothetical protein